jgi:hypothetical protein
MKIQDLKRIIKEELAKVLAEAGTAPAPVKTPAKPTTKPSKPGPVTPGKDVPKPRPHKAKKEEVKETREETLVKGIMNKYKKLKK